MQRRTKLGALGAAVCTTAALGWVVIGRAAVPPVDDTAIDDSHVHLTNYVQHGSDIQTMLRVMGTKVHRAVLFGIPLQQMWSSRVDGTDVKNAPKYYLESDSPLYYYSFTDAVIAQAFLSLSPAERERFDPMITGFNPADMYAADHVLRVLDTFPGVFEGIGEFSIHKEFVTSKVAGDPPSLDDPALDRLLAVAEDKGLVVLVHCDIDTPFPKPGDKPAYLEDVKALFARHPKATIIWAHTGVGRVVRPVHEHAAALAAILDDPKLQHVNFDLSWNETAKYVVASPESLRITAELIEKHPDRFLFGTDEVAPSNQDDYLRVFRQYQPLWDKLTPETRALVLRGNYERIFDAARRRAKLRNSPHG